MAQLVEGPHKTFAASAAIPELSRVKLTAGKLAACGTADDAACIGTTERPAYANGDLVPVRLRTAQGTRRGLADGAIGLGATVYPGANGTFSATQTGGAAQQGTALNAATAAGDVVEILSPS